MRSRRPSQSYSDAEGYRLGTWVAKQRQSLAKGKLGPDRRLRLSKLHDWEWTPRSTGRAPLGICPR